MLKIHILLFLICVSLLRHVLADCTVNKGENLPLFVKVFGSRRALLNKNIGSVKLSSGESMEAFCYSNLILKSDYSNYLQENAKKRNLILRCDVFSDSLSYSFDYSDKYVTINRNEATISCSERGESNLYLSKGSLPFCENYTSFTIDIPWVDICYDLDTSSLKYVSYFTPGQMQSEFVKEQTLFEVLQYLGDKVGSWEAYFPSTIFAQSFPNATKTSNRFLSLFDYESLIQDPSTLQRLGELNVLMKVLWFHNLRLGNWKLFLEALWDRSVHVRYHVYMGVSGELSMPESKCNLNKTLSIAVDNFRITAPKYIWAYISALNAGNPEEIVVVGHNSPFNDGVIFCNDMCDEIEWLQSGLFGKLRLLPAMGTIFCCHPEEVRDHLNYFAYSNGDIQTTLIP